VEQAQEWEAKAQQSIAELEQAQLQIRALAEEASRNAKHKEELATLQEEERNGAQGVLGQVRLELETVRVQCLALECAVGDKDRTLRELREGVAVRQAEEAARQAEEAARQAEEAARQAEEAARLRADLDAARTAIAELEDSADKMNQFKVKTMDYVKGLQANTEACESKVLLLLLLPPPPPPLLLLLLLHITFAFTMHVLLNRRGSCASS
jgi:hypothetical protein